MKKFLVTFLVVIACMCNPLIAQDKEISKGKLGLTFPTTGIIWHLSDNIAFLPNAGYNHNWSSFEASPNTSSIGSLSVGVGFRFYAREWKGVRFYFSPRYSLVRSGSRSESVSLAGFQATSSGTAYDHRFTGGWGMQYPISSRVSIYGDIGAYYAHTRSSSTPTSTTSERRSHQFGTTGTWGLILYLK